MMRPQIATLVDTLRVSAAARWTTVQLLRSRTRALLRKRRAWRRRRRADIAPAPPADFRDDLWLETEVVGVIARHPDGVRAVEIGNELGVDWRCVPAIVRSLVDRAVVEQIADEFYPARKAS